MGGGLDIVHHLSRSVSVGGGELLHLRSHLSRRIHKLETFALVTAELPP